MRAKPRSPLDRYIFRATLGLPKNERLDTAAELRTHLTEQVEELMAQGFAKDEAEYLAVQAMGDVKVTNRQLLGHVFTHRLGWAALGVVLVGGLGWYAFQNWMPPRTGVTYGAPTLQDMARLFVDPDAPRADNYQAATVTYPQKTRAVYYAYVTPFSTLIGLNDIDAFKKDNMPAGVPGSYRFQERWLINTKKQDGCGPSKDEQHWGAYYTASSLPSHFFNGPWSVGTGATRETNGCSGIVARRANEAATRPLPLDLGVRRGNAPLELDDWTILWSLSVDPKSPAFGEQPRYETAQGLYLAVLPSSKPLIDGAMDRQCFNIPGSWPPTKGDRRLQIGVGPTCARLPDLFILDPKTGAFVR